MIALFTSYFAHKALASMFNIIHSYRRSTVRQSQETLKGPEMIHVIKKLLKCIFMYTDASLIYSVKH